MTLPLWKYGCHNFPTIIQSCYICHPPKPLWPFGCWVWVFGLRCVWRPGSWLVSWDTQFSFHVPYIPDYKDRKCQKIHLSCTYNKCEVSIFNTVTFRGYPATVPYLIFCSIWYLIPASSDPQIGAYCLQQLPFRTHCPLFYCAIHIHTLNLPDDSNMDAKTVRNAWMKHGFQWFWCFFFTEK